MMTPLIVTTSSFDFNLSQGEVHVWCALLLQPTYVVEYLHGLLSGDEKARAKQYYFTHLQKSFVVSRGVLRILLAHYTELQPEQLAFTYLQAGKPELSDRHDSKVFFNLSHSNEFVLYAFSRSRNVGIDIEHIRPVNDLELIAESNFSAYETNELKKLSPAKVLDGFFNCWTRKEAYVKAIGDGVSFPLQEFDVSLTPDQPARLLSIRGSAQEAARWSMVELHPAAKYAAALVVEGSIHKVFYREWNGLDQLINILQPK
jgi:4'-phosphopantetheinyl transferase